MKVKKSVITHKELQDILDSDDELPSAYTDIEEIPAYKDDNRFNHILGGNKKNVHLPTSSVQGKTPNESLQFASSLDNNSFISKYLLENVVQLQKSPLNEISNKPNKSSSDKDSLTVSNHLLKKNKKVLQAPGSPLTDKSNKPTEFVPSSDKDSSTLSNNLLKKNKKVLQPPGSPLNEKSNKAIEFISSSDKSNSNISNNSLNKSKKIPQPPESQISEKSKSIDSIGSVDKDNLNVSSNLLKKDKKVVQKLKRSNNDKFNNTLNKVSSSGGSHYADDIYTDRGEGIKDRLLVKKAVLSGGDIVCLKCVEATHNNYTLLWFMKYMLFKDMHLEYAHLSSCLVGSLENDISDCKRDYEYTSKRKNVHILLKCN